MLKIPQIKIKRMVNHSKNNLKINKNFNTNKLVHGINKHHNLVQNHRINQKKTNKMFTLTDLFL